MSDTRTHEQPTPTRRTSRPVLVDLGIVVVWFLVAGVVAGLVWWHFTDLPRASRQGGSVVVDSVQLLKQANIDAWYFVVAAVGGLASGLALLTWRRRDPLLMVALVTLGGGLAALVTLRLGLWLGPGSEVAALRHRPDGASAPMQLKLHAPGMAWVWPISAALGALLQLWVLRPPDDESTPSAYETSGNS